MQVDQDRHRGAAQPVWAGTASCKDQDCLLQRLIEERGLSRQEIRFSGIHVSSPEIKDRYGRFFVSFLPAVSDETAKSMRRAIRGWRMHRMTDKSIKDLACMFNPVIRGWINYYSQFYKSALYPILKQLNHALQRWAYRKYKKLHGRKRKALQLLQRIAKQMPYMFAHWRFVGQLAGR